MSYADTSEAQDAALDKRTGQTVSTAGFANLAGVSGNTVEAWVKAGMPEKRAAGGHGVARKLDSAQCIVWLIRRERERVTAAIGKAEAKDDNPKDRMMIANARLKELEVTRKEGEVVEMAAVELLFTNLVANARTRLLALPSRVAPQCAGAEVGEIKTLLDTVVCECLEELAAADPAALLMDGEERANDAG